MQNGDDGLGYPNRDREYREEARYLLQCAVYENQLGQIQQAMLDRMREADLSYQPEGERDDEEAEFWLVVTQQLSQPEVCDGIGVKLSDISEGYSSGAVTSQKCANRLTRLYDDAVANVESLAALERRFLIVTTATLRCSESIGREHQTETSLRTVFQRLTENGQCSDRPSRSQAARMLQDIADRDKYTRSVLQAIHDGCEPTFWEMVAAGMYIPGGETELMTAILMEALRDIRANKVSISTMGWLRLANDLGMRVANDTRQAAVVFRELADLIRLTATESGLEIGSHVRNEPWRRLNPYLRYDEGVRL